MTAGSGSIVNTSGTAVAVKDKKPKEAHFVMTGGTLTDDGADRGQRQRGDNTVRSPVRTVRLTEAAIIVNDNVTPDN